MAMKRMLRRHVSNQDELVFSLALHAKPGTEGPEWEEEDEFSLHGKMYDVIDKKIENGKLVVRCIADEKETELIKKFQQVLEKQFGNRAKKRSASLLKIITTPFTLPSTLLPPAFLVLRHTEFPNLQFNFPVACRDVITPPPRFL